MSSSLRWISTPIISTLERKFKTLHWLKLTEMLIYVNFNQFNEIKASCKPLRYVTHSDRRSN